MHSPEFAFLESGVSALGIQGRKQDGARNSVRRYEAEEELHANREIGVPGG
jgi:hypothetical protein